MLYQSRVDKQAASNRFDLTAPHGPTSRSFFKNLKAPARTIRLSLLILLLGGFLTNVYAALANYGKRGLRAYSIEGVLRLDEDEIDLCTAALILSRDWGTTKTSHVYRKQIDDLAREIIERVKDAHVPMDYRAIPVINKYLFEEAGFAAVDNAEDPDDLFLHKVVERRQGYCLSLSVLYLSISERLGLPIYGVVVPGHFFVRYDDGKTRFNIETTSFGNYAPDAHYKEKFKAPRHVKSLYMQNLTKKQTVGCFFNNLGNCYLQIGDTDRAFEILSDAIRVNPLLSEAHMNLGNIYLQKQMPYEAIHRYEEALSIVGRDGHAFNGLGAAYMQLKQYRKAESYFKTALSLEADNPDIYRNLARALHFQDKNLAAVSELKSALSLSPDDVESRVLLGQIYQKLKQIGNALYQLERATQLAPYYAPARVALGYLYLENEKTDQALTEFQFVIDRIGEDSQAWFGIARVYETYGQTDNVIWAYERVLEMSPNMIGALQNLGNAYLDKDMTARAITVYQRAVNLETENGDLRYNLAIALAKDSRHEEAINQFFTTIDLDGNAAAAYNGIAISYYRLADYENAKIYAIKAKALGYNVQEALLKL